MIWAVVGGIIIYKVLSKTAKFAGLVLIASANDPKPNERLRKAGHTPSPYEPCKYAYDSNGTLRRIGNQTSQDSSQFTQMSRPG